MINKTVPTLNSTRFTYERTAHSSILYVQYSIGYTDVSHVADVKIYRKFPGARSERGILNQVLLVLQSRRTYWSAKAVAI